jgi:hypothetical protein
MAKRRGWKLADLPFPEQRAAAASQMSGAGFEDLPMDASRGLPSGHILVPPMEGPAPKKRRTARRRAMNRTEAAYAAQLELRRAAGEIRSFEFEAVRLNIGEGAWYTPDFLVLRFTVETGFTVEFHEVKGSWKAKNARDGRTRLKAAAKQYPWARFVAVTKRRLRDASGPGWDVEEIG